MKVHYQSLYSSGSQTMVVAASDYGSALALEMICSWGMFENKKCKIVEVELLTLINLKYLAPQETLSG